MQQSLNLRESRRVGIDIVEMLSPPSEGVVFEEDLVVDWNFML